MAGSNEKAFLKAVLNLHEILSDKKGLATLKKIDEAIARQEASAKKLGDVTGDLNRERKRLQAVEADLDRRARDLDAEFLSGQQALGNDRKVLDAREAEFEATKAEFHEAKKRMEAGLERRIEQANDVQREAGMKLAEAEHRLAAAAIAEEELSRREQSARARARAALEDMGA